jgi:hypothetical protein
MQCIMLMHASGRVTVKQWFKPRVVKERLSATAAGTDTPPVRRPGCLPTGPLGRGRVQAAKHECARPLRWPHLPARRSFRVEILEMGGNRWRSETDPEQDTKRIREGKPRRGLRIPNCVIVACKKPSLLIARVVQHVPLGDRHSAQCKPYCFSMYTMLSHAHTSNSLTLATMFAPFTQ